MADQRPKPNISGYMPSRLSLSRHDPPGSSTASSCQIYISATPIHGMEGTKQVLGIMNKDCWIARTIDAERRFKGFVKDGSIDGEWGKSWGLIVMEDGRVVAYFGRDLKTDKIFMMSLEEPTNPEQLAEVSKFVQKWISRLGLPVPC